MIHDICSLCLQLCFAYKGEIQDRLKVQYRYKECSNCDEQSAYDTFYGVGINYNEDGR